MAGTCSGSGVVSVSVARGASPLRGWSRRTVGTAVDGSFTAQVSGLPTGGPYKITFSAGADRATVKDVHVGDVWVLAGQSNMQGVGNLDRAPRPHPLVRACYMDGHWGVAKEPLHVMEESPDPVHNPNQVTREQAARVRAGLNKGVTLGVPFGAEMVARTSVPQGLICVAHGGTSMEQWDPAKKPLGGGSLYGSMMRSIRATGQPVAGVLWYQGESDAGPDPVKVYSERMRALVAAIRADLKDRALPFLMVQIGRFVREDATPLMWNGIQEQQRLLKRTIKRLECVPAVDLQLDDLIHIGSDGLRRLGVRLARVADLVAHRSREAPGIEPVRVRRLLAKDHPICQVAYEVTFANVVGGLRSQGEPSGFAVVDAKQRPVSAIYKTVLDGDRVILETTLAEDRGDLSVMYGQGENPYANIVDARDMAVPVFGPLPIENRLAATAYLTSWRVVAVRPAEDIARMPRPGDADVDGAERREFVGTFVNMHETWKELAGHASFSTDMHLPEDMALELRIGYDGPIRVWIDDAEVLHDMKGTNPALADAVVKPLKLTAGKRRITVLMALNGGRAWGFFMRFSRTGLAKKALVDGGYVLPTFG